MFEEYDYLYPQGSLTLREEEAAIIINSLKKELEENEKDPYIVEALQEFSPQKEEKK
jgi:hypothetical protein